MLTGKQFMTLAGRDSLLATIANEDYRMPEAFTLEDLEDVIFPKVCDALRKYDVLLESSRNYFDPSIEVSGIESSIYDVLHDVLNNESISIDLSEEERQSLSALLSEFVAQNGGYFYSKQNLLDRKEGVAVENDFNMVDGRLDKASIYRDIYALTGHRVAGQTLYRNGLMGVRDIDGHEFSVMMKNGKAYVPVQCTSSEMDIPADVSVVRPDEIENVMWVNAHDSEIVTFSMHDTEGKATGRIAIASKSHFNNDYLGKLVTVIDERKKQLNREAAKNMFSRTKDFVKESFRESYEQTLNMMDFVATLRPSGKPVSIELDAAFRYNVIERFKNIRERFATKRQSRHFADDLNREFRFRAGLHESMREVDHNAFQLRRHFNPVTGTETFELRNRCHAGKREHNDCIGVFQVTALGKVVIPELKQFISEKGNIFSSCETLEDCRAMAESVVLHPQNVSLAREAANRRAVEKACGRSLNPVEKTMVKAYVEPSGMRHVCVYDSSEEHIPYGVFRAKSKAEAEKIFGENTVVHFGNDEMREFETKRREENSRQYKEDSKGLKDHSHLYFEPTYLIVGPNNHPYEKVAPSVLSFHKAYHRESLKKFKELTTFLYNDIADDAHAPEMAVHELRERGLVNDDNYSTVLESAKDLFVDELKLEGGFHTVTFHTREMKEAVTLQLNADGNIILGTAKENFIVDSIGEAKAYILEAVGNMSKMSEHIVEKFEASVSEAVSKTVSTKAETVAKSVADDSDSSSDGTSDNGDGESIELSDEDLAAILAEQENNDYHPHK